MDYAGDTVNTGLTAEQLKELIKQAVIEAHLELQRIADERKLGQARSKHMGILNG